VLPPALDIELRHLRSYLVLAEELHFGRAAKRLGIAQPPLSQQIARFERLLGYTLFTRRPRVALTAAGAALLAPARRALEQVAYGVDATRRAGRGESGILTIGFAASTMATRVPEVLRLFRRRHPGVELVLRELSTTAQVDALRSGVIDCGFLREPVADAAIVAERVVREPFSAVLPAAHRLAAHRTIDLAALASEGFVLFPRAVAPALYDQVRAICRTAGFEPRQVQEAEEWLTIVGLVDAGLGVSIVPASFERLRWGKVTYHRLARIRRLTTISMCHRAGEQSALVMAFEALARETFGSATHARRGARPAPATNR
jgi:DNA-binding transcriptional LysR family regulator